MRGAWPSLRPRVILRTPQRGFVQLSPFVLGWVLGLVSSTPLGPINLHVARCAHQRRSTEMWCFVGGVVAADGVVAFLALTGLLAAGLSESVLRSIGIIGGAAFALYGIASFLRRRADDSASDAQGRSGLWSFVMGLLFCGLNPAFYLFWLYGSSLMLATMPNKSHWTSFLGGVVTGDLSWFLLFVLLVSRARERISLASLKTGSAILITVFGVVAIWRSIHGGS